MKTIPNAKPFEKLFGKSTPAKSAGLAFSIASLLMIAISLLLAIVVAVAQVNSALAGNEVSAELPDWALYLSYILPQLAFALSVWFALAYQGIRIKTAVVSQKCKLRYFLVAIVLQAGLMSLSQLNDLFLQLLGGLGYESAGISIPSLDGFGVVGVIIVIAVLPALFEELFFRGVLLNGLRIYKVWSAVLLSGAFFSLYHQNPAQTVYQFCCGCAFALVAIRSGSVLPTVLAHFLNNTVVILLTKFGISGFSTAALWILMPVFAVCLIASLVYLIFIDKNKPEQDETAGERKNFFKCASVGIALCSIMWIMTFVSGL